MRTKIPVKRRSNRSVNRAVTCMLVVAFLLIGTMFVVNMNGHQSSADIGYGDPIKEDYVPGVNIEIDTIDKLKLIGKDPGYPLTGKYVQTKDLNFDLDPFSTTDLGWKYKIVVTYSDMTPGGSVHFHIEENSGGSFQPMNGTNISVRFGNYSSDAVSIVNGEFDVPNSTSMFDGNLIMLVVGGVKSTGTDTAFSFIMEVESSGDSKEGYHLGNFKPISNFRGTYNGNGYQIIGVEMGAYTATTSRNIVGIFGTAISATIKNVYIEDGESSATRSKQNNMDSVGLIAGQITNSIVENCYTNGKVGLGDRAGGLIGNVISSTIRNCTNAGTIFATHTYGGGIAGYAENSSEIYDSINLGNLIEPRAQSAGIAGCLANDSKAWNVVNKGNVKGGGYNGGLVGHAHLSDVEGINHGDIKGGNLVGGLVAWSGGSVSGTNYGNIEGNNLVGGITGESTVYGVITDSVNYGNIKGNGNVGGITGKMYANYSILNSVNYGDVTGSNSRVGGIAGESAGEISNVVNYGNVDGGGVYVGGIVGECLRNNNPVSGVNYGDVRGGGENVGGIIGWAAFSKMTVTAINYGNIIGESNYVGGIVGQSDASPTIKDSINYGNVTGKIYVGGILAYGAGMVSNVANNGTIKGGSYVGGIVGYIDNLNISGINNGDVSGTGNNVGGIAGTVAKIGSTISGTNSGNVTGVNNIGGIAGTVAKDSRIIGATNLGNVTGSTDFVGGIVGNINNNAIVKDCNNNGNIKGRNNVGGLVGRSVLGIEISGQPNNYENTGSVSGNENVGGIVGNASGISMEWMSNKGYVYATVGNAGGVIGTVYMTSSNGLLVEYTFSEGDVRALTGHAGGLVGTITSTAMNTGSLIHDSYSMGDITVTNTPASVGGIVGRVTGNYVSIDNTYSSGKVTYSSGTMYGGGIVGSLSGSNLSVTDSFFKILSGDGTDLTNNMSPAYGGKPTYDYVMKREGTYTKVGWDFTTAGVWAIDEMNKTSSSLNQGYPFFGDILNQYYIEIIGPNVTTVPPQGMYGPVNSGDSVLVSFTPDARYVIQKVLIDGVEDTDALFDGYYLFEDIYTSHVIEIMASIPAPPSSEYVIHASSDDNSIISPEGTITVGKGHNMRFLFSAAPGHVISNVLIDGINHPELALIGSFVFWDVSMNHTIRVESLEAREMITLVVYVMEGVGHVEYSIGGGVFREYTSPISVIKGTDIVFRAIPGNGHSFDRWENYVSSTDPKIEIINIDASGILEVYFKEGGSGGIGELIWYSGCCLLILFLILLLFLLLFIRYKVFIRISFGPKDEISNIKLIPERPFTLKYRIDDEDDWAPIPQEEDGSYPMPEEVRDIVNIRDRVHRKASYRFRIEGISAVRYKIEKDGEWFPLQKGEDGSYEVPGKEVLSDIWIEIDGDLQ